MAEHQSHNHGQQKPFNHDEHLIREIKEALNKGTESAGIDVKVSAEDGAVRLYGVVDVLSQKTAAEAIVRKVPGVTHIDNDITVANEEAHSDKAVFEAVTNKLAGTREFRQVGCQVHKGIVTLVGHAGSYGDVNAAIRLVEGMPGVREVRVEKVKVGEGEKEDDAAVSKAALQMLSKMGYDPQMFQVYSDAGVLFVKGIVPTREDRSRIKTAMHKIRGVEKLEATLVSEDQMDPEVH